MSFAADVYQTSSLIPGVPNPLGIVVRPLFDSGSLVGLGGSIPVTISGAQFTVSGSFGSEIQADQGVPGNITNPWYVTPVSGGLYVGTFLNPFWVTGSVYVLNPSSGGAGGNVTLQSGSVTGLLVGGQALSSGNPAPITGSVGITAPVAVSNFPASFNVGNFPTTQAITGSVGLTGPVTGTVSISSAVAVTQGTSPWTITGSVGLSAPVTGSVGLSGPITGSVKISEAVAVSNFPANQAVTVQNPVTVTGSIGITGPITGTVAIASSVAVNNFPSSFNVGNFPSTQNVVDQSGSVVGLLQGGLPVSMANPIPITGSVFVINQSGAASNVTAVSGSVAGLLVGGVAVSSANPVPVTGSVGITAPVAVSNFPASFNVGNFPATQNVTGSAWTPTITGSVVVANQVNVTGSVGLTGPITGTVAIASSVAVNNFPASQTVAGTVTANQGTANAAPWAVTGSVQIVSGGLGAQVLNAAPGSDTGQPALAVRVISSVGGGSAVTAQSGSVTGLLVGGVAVSSANPVPVTGSVGLTGPITGSVSIASSVAINNFPASQTVAGTVTANQGTANAAPWAVTGSVQIVSGGLGAQVLNSAPGSDTGQPALAVRVISSVGGGSAVTAQSGSVTGLLVGGVAVSNANPVPVTGSVGITGPITGSVILASAPTVVQGTNPWIVSGSAWTPTITGSVVVANQVNVTGSTWTPTITGSVGITGPITGSVTLAAAPTVNQGTSPWTVGGSVSVSNFPATQNVTGSAWTPTITGSVTVQNQVNVTGSTWTPTITGSVTLSSSPIVSGFDSGSIGRPLQVDWKGRQMMAGGSDVGTPISSSGYPVVMAGMDQVGNVVIPTIISLNGANAHIVDSPRIVWLLEQILLELQISNRHNEELSKKNFNP